MIQELGLRHRQRRARLSGDQESAQSRTSRPTRLRRRTAAVIAGAVFAAVLPASAAAYWDFSGTLSPGNSYGEGQGLWGMWMFRLSRSNCNAKMELRIRGGGWTSAPAPGGCADSDFGGSYDTADFDASHAINQGGSDVYVNVRIDATV